MDGEVDPEGRDKTLGALCKCHQLRARWERMHLARDVMQNEFANHLDSDFASRISAAIEQEATPVADTKIVEVDFYAARKTPQWVRPVGGFAIAATVAAISVLGLGYLQPIGNAPQLASSGSDGRPVVAVAPQQVLKPAAGDFKLVDNTGTYWTVGRHRVSNPGMEERLNTFLSDHTEFATARSVGGMLPYSRIVGYDEVRK